MRSSRLEPMHDHVRAIFRSLTGSELPESGAAAGGGVPTFDDVAHRFAELESIARSIPSWPMRVPPFSFTPPLDVIGTAREMVFELGVPGIENGELEVELVGGELIVWGARADPAAADGRIYFHAEMPRGPFRRVIDLPEPTSGSPRIEVENGIVRVRLVRMTRSPLPRA